jgi:hypothetical protein
LTKFVTFHLTSFVNHPAPPAYALSRRVFFHEKAAIYA